MEKDNSKITTFLISKIEEISETEHQFTPEFFEFF